MIELPNEIFRKWGHSFEEDAGSIKVYRPNTFNFPRGRGRAGIEFKRDGTYIDWIIDRTDAQKPISGRWRIESSVMQTHSNTGQHRIRLSFEGNLRGERIVEITSLDNDVLKLREA